MGNLPHNNIKLPPIDDDDMIILKPNSIIDTHWLKQGSKLIEQSLVRWKKLPAEEATWEDTTLIQQQFPSLTFADKCHLSEGGIDREPNRSARVPKPNYIYDGYV